MHTTPLSAIKRSVTAVNFPSLQHFFPCKEAVGSATITDIIGGVVITPASMTCDGAKLTAVTVSANTALTAGAWATLGTKKPLIMVMGTNAASFDISIGNTGSGVRMRITDAVTVLNDGTTALADVVAPCTPITDGFVYMYIDKASAAAAILHGMVVAASQPVLTPAGNGTLQAASIGAPGSFMSFTGFSNVYGIAIFYVNTIPLPSEFKTMAHWMREQWADNNKYIYEGFKDKT